MLRGMSARHFHEWRAYDDLEPFDEERADIRAGSIVQAIYSTSPGRRRGSPPIRLMDCVVRFGAGSTESPRTAEQAREEVSRAMDLCMLIFNGSAEKESKPRVRRAQ